MVASYLHHGEICTEQKGLDNFTSQNIPTQPPFNLEKKISCEFLSWGTTYFGNIRVFKLSRGVILLFSLSLISEFEEAKILTSTLAVFYFSNFSFVCNKTTEYLPLSLSLLSPALPLILPSLANKFVFLLGTSKLILYFLYRYNNIIQQAKI